MTHTITLDKKTEDGIAQKARRLGVSPDVLLTRIASEAVAGEELNEPKPMTGAQLLAALRADDILTGYGDPAVDSADLARQLRDKSQWRNNDK